MLLVLVFIFLIIVNISLCLYQICQTTINIKHLEKKLEEKEEELDNLKFKEKH